MKLDALLYVLLGTLPMTVALFTTDSAAKYVSPQSIFWVTVVLSIVGSAAGNLKAFRSQSFGNYLTQREKDKDRAAAVVVAAVEATKTP